MPTESLSDIGTHIILIVIIVVSLIEIPGLKLYDFYRSALDLLNKLISKVPKWISATPGLLVTLAVFTTLQNKLHLYGDGHLIMGQIMGGEIPSKTAFLFSHLTLAIKDLAHLDTYPEIELMLRMISILSGLIFVFGLHKLCGLLFTGRTARITAFLLVATCGATVMFYGYIETYPLFLALTVLFSWLALRAIVKQVSIWPAVLVLILGTVWHYLFMVFIPAGIYLLIYRNKFLPGKLLFAGLCGLMLTVYMIGQSLSREGIAPFLPLLANQQTSYTLFSISHLTDFLNAMLVAGPFLTFAGLMGAVIILVNSRVRSKRISFFMFMFLPALSLAFITDPALGAIRDWDLLAVFIFPGILLSLVLFAHLENNGKALKSLVVPLLLFNLLHTGGFLILNRDVDFALERMVAVLVDDPHYQSDYYFGSRTESLAMILEDVYGRETVARKLRSRRQSRLKDREKLVLANRFYQMGTYRNACIRFEKYDQEYGLPIASKCNYAKTLYLLDDCDRAVEIFKKILTDSINTDFYYYLADCYDRLDEPDSSRKYMRLYQRDVPEEKELFERLKSGLNLSEENARDILIMRWLGQYPCSKYPAWSILKKYLRSAEQAN
ncbi:MAG: hypothetical protein GF404_04245 [candidate division Zixibacteria bacterium]|nr:hypothetical protein [candidate division Zixibacteria bacterium]